MTDAIDRNTDEAHQMFSTGDSTNPRTRQEKVTIYRRIYKDGPFYKMLKRGQQMTILGFVVVLLGGISSVFIN